MEYRFQLGNRRVELVLIQEDPSARAGLVEAPLTIESFDLGERYLTLRAQGHESRLLYKVINGHIHVAVGGRSYEFVPAEEAEDEANANVGTFTPEVTSPMPGKVLDVQVTVGDTVKADQPLMLLEAMKMEQTIRAAAACTVVEIRVQAGSMVGPGDVLMLLRALADEEP